MRPIFQLLDLALSLYMLIILARVLLTWLNPDPRHPLVRFLCRATDPLLDRIRRIVPLQFGGVDFSPMVLLLVLSFLSRLLRLAAH